jgi:hypothetical protein
VDKKSITVGFSSKPRTSKIFQLFTLEKTNKYF